MSQDVKDVLKLLESWKFRLSYAQTGHYARSEQHLRMHEYLGVVLVIVSAFVSCFLFFDAQNKTSPNIKIYVAMAGILATVLASLQTFLRLGEKAELHRAKAARYGSLKRQVEIQIAKGFDDIDKAINFVELVGVRWDHISDDAPVTPQSVRRRIAKLMEEEKALQGIGVKQEVAQPVQ